MKKFNDIIVLTMVIGFAASGCRHVGLGQAPLDTDLLNDGSAAEQQQRVDAYRLSIEQQRVKRPGVHPGARGLSQPQASVHSDQTHAYLMTSEAAAAELSTPAVAFSRLVSSDAFKAGVTLAFASAGAAVAVSAYGPTAAEFVSSGGGNSDEAMMAVGSVGGAMVWAEAEGALSAFPVLAMNNLLLVPFADGVAEADYQAAVVAYNRDLAERVARLEIDPAASVDLAPTADATQPAKLPTADTPAPVHASR